MGKLGAGATSRMGGRGTRRFHLIDTPQARQNPVKVHFEVGLRKGASRRTADPTLPVALGLSKGAVLSIFRHNAFILFKSMIDKVLRLK